MDRLEYWDFDWGWVALDAIIFAVISVCSFAIARWWDRFQIWRFSLSTLFVAMTVAAFAILFSQLEFDLMRRLSALISSTVGSYYPLTLYSPWISVPVLCGLASVSIMVARLLGPLIQRLII